MKKTLMLALTAATLLGTAAPVLASPFGNGNSDSRDFQATGILNQLQRAGVDATGVEEWGQYVRAYVVQADGSVAMAYYDPITLNEVTPVAP